MNQQPSEAARSAALSSITPYLILIIGIVLILALESVGVRVLLGVATLCLVAWAVAGRVTRPNLKLGMISALLRDDENLQVLPNEKYSASGFPTVEKPHDFALTLRTSLSRERAVECLALHFGSNPEWDVTRMEDPFTADGRRLDLVMYPEPARTTRYHVSVGARRSRPGMLRIRLKRM